MNRPRVLALVLLSLLATGPVLAQPAPPAGRAATVPHPPRASAPTAPTISTERLARLDPVVQKYVDDQRIAGAVTLVAQHGRLVQLKAYGKRDVEQDAAMTTDTIFRIASMSKAVTSVAVMLLVEEGALLLSDPVSKFLPAFEHTQVAVAPPTGAPPGAVPTVVPAKRPITIRDLLTHTSGISYGAGSPAEAEYKAAGAYYWYLADKNEPIGDVVDRLASVPFDAQPGEKYVYGFNTDILGRVVEVASGQALDEFFRTRIFGPLKMTDTSFFLPREKAARLATVYGAGPDGRIVRAPDRGRDGQGEYVEGPRKCFSGGAGLLSTAHDYARLLQMLLDGGALDGVRLLSPASIALMTTNHVGSLYDNGNLGFGLGFEVVEDVGRAGRLAALGEYSWGSAYYSRYFVDPVDGVVGVFLAQLIPARGLDLQNKFRSLVYQAIVPAPAAGGGPRSSGDR
jgi:CubicO group peptidase (beta-lactamase class C family)